VVVAWVIFASPVLPLAWTSSLFASVDDGGGLDRPRGRMTPPRLRRHCRIPGEGWRFTSDNRLLCAGCGAWRVALISGGEMRLASSDLADAPIAVKERVDV